MVHIKERPTIVPTLRTCSDETSKPWRYVAGVSVWDHSTPVTRSGLRVFLFFWTVLGLYTLFKKPKAKPSVFLLRALSSGWGTQKESHQRWPSSSFDTYCFGSSTADDTRNKLRSDRSREWGIRQRAMFCLPNNSGDILEQVNMEPSPAYPSLYF